MQPAHQISVIGAGFGALSTVQEIRQRDPDAHMTPVASRAERHHLPGIIRRPSGLRTREQLVVPWSPVCNTVAGRCSPRPASGATTRW